MGYDRNSYETKEGTITITMVDAKSDKVIWQGWTTEEVDRNITSNDIQSGVKNIFRKFDLAKK
jgi:prophage tail gpP-like protein